MKDDIIHIRLNPGTRDKLDALIALYKEEAAVGVVTQSDVVRHAILELARIKETS